MTVRRVVVDHVLFVVADLEASRRLYTAALAPLGYEELYVQEDCVSYGADGLDDFTICRGEPVTTAAHVAFDAPDRGAVDAFFGSAIGAPDDPTAGARRTRPRRRRARRLRGHGGPLDLHACTTRTRRSRRRRGRRPPAVACAAPAQGRRRSGSRAPRSPRSPTERACPAGAPGSTVSRGPDASRPRPDPGAPRTGRSAIRGLPSGQ